MPDWRTRIRRAALTLVTPSLADLFFVALLVVAFGRPLTLQALLADGDTGWHIRTGDFILQARAVPVHDLFSFSRPDAPWFSWEWLSDVLFALGHRWQGLSGVAGLSAAVLCLAATCLLCWLLRRGAGFWLAAAVTLTVINASSVHYLARPHIFSLLGFTLGLWIVDEDRRRPGWRLWLLVPLTAVWANLHGAFVAWLATLLVLVAASAAERNRAAVRRYGWLWGLSAAATLLNPYGWRLHQHIASYLGSSWILDNVQELQSPSIRSENMVVFAGLLLAGVALASRTLARRQWFEGGLVLVWGLAALRSARHIPLFAIAAAPVVAAECASWWSAWSARAPARSAAALFWQAGQDLGRAPRLSVWAPLLGGLVLSFSLAHTQLGDFPEIRFPVAAVARNLDRLTPSPTPAPRILTSDQWGDYLIFRFYPRQRVFFDGRSDFYGPALGRDYQILLTAARPWPEVLARYRFDVALLPLDWPLASVLERDPEWQLVYRDKMAALLVRRPAGLKDLCQPADGKD
ncbi:MAG: hypothetical protein LAP40_20815 [Acidobacteriia bacterium]|nr:hypothetical protein [Terriglobia bacterium]